MMTTIWAGLSIGAIYAIVAIGYNIVFIASRVFNFAQAQFVMIGTFIALEVGRTFDLPLPLAVLVAALAGGLIGGLEEILAIRRLRGRGAHNELVTTLGVATILSGAALLIWGSSPQRLPYFSGDASLSIFGGRVLPVELLMIFSALILAVVVGIVTRKTMIGLAGLATSEDADAAKLRGINGGWLALGAFVVAGALLAAVGPLVGAKTFAIYNLGDLLAVKAFVALAIGGFGSYAGALVGGFAVGLLEAFAARYIGSEWQNITVFILLLVALLAIPQGFFGRRAVRTV
ncbi:MULTISPECIES: branched-chain amino acid ABC transporter permease [unclassified Microbacterium]|uniref:branched-chain amino acid ABC transporter permease n=1 Tax=unclassified Microbacterium TaxID=2609290 RepID=UPI003019A70D